MTWLPTKEGKVVELSICGKPCWCRYERWFVTHTGFILGDRASSVRDKLCEHWKIELPNGLVASIVRKPGSYGYSQGLYELAFFKGPDLHGDFHVLKDWDEEVMGYLSESDLLYWIDKALKEGAGYSTDLGEGARDDEKTEQGKTGNWWDDGYRGGSGGVPDAGDGML